jgi:hypothetical protein
MQAKVLSLAELASTFTTMDRRSCSRHSKEHFSARLGWMVTQMEDTGTIFNGLVNIICLPTLLRGEKRVISKGYLQKKKYVYLETYAVQRECRPDPMGIEKPSQPA